MHCISPHGDSGGRMCDKVAWLGQGGRLLRRHAHPPPCCMLTMTGAVVELPEEMEERHRTCYLGA